jgi:hypothetical protein
MPAVEALLKQKSDELTPLSETVEMLGLIAAQAGQIK